MTYFKLSLRNARRQAKDYLVYFVTIVMAAGLIYAFNGLIFSREVRALSGRLEHLTETIVLASIVVVCIIGWLVSYTINFMLTRRSREFGIYILAGLENRQAAKLFFLENIAVGVCAMAFGFLVGNLVYQVLRAVILALFGTVYTFSFAFSLPAAGLTLCYFLLIYMRAQFKSCRRICSMKIYDLIYLDRVNEEVVIGTSKRRRKIFTFSIVLGVIGTILLSTRDWGLASVGAVCIIVFLYGFFLSFASGVPAYFEKRPVKKYTGQNLLVFRTLTAKLATMGIVMATVALIFTATLVSEGAGQVISGILQGRVVPMTCFDLIVSHENRRAAVYRNCLNYVRENIAVADSWQYDIFLVQTREVADEIEAHTKYYPCYPGDTIMRESDYHALRKMLGYPPVTLAEGHYLIHCQPYVKEALRDWKKSITAGGYELMPGGIHTESFAQYLWKVNGNGYILVVPDEAAQGCQVAHTMYVAMTKEPVSEKQYEELENMSFEALGNLVVPGSAEAEAPDNMPGSAEAEAPDNMPGSVEAEAPDNMPGSAEAEASYNVADDTEENMWCMVYAKSIDKADAASMTAMCVFPLYYLALVLIMTAATILTIQQLCETKRYRRQFELLHKLGMEYREMKRTLQKQIAIYYAMPVAPAVLIAVVFVTNMGNSVEPGIMVGGRHPLVIVGIMLGLFFLIYGIYIFLAYTGLKRNVLEQ